MKAFVVVDYQKDFVNGSLGFEGAEKLDSKIAERIKQERAKGSEIIFTLDTHGKDYLKTKEGKSLPVCHCIKGSEGHALFGKTAEQCKESDMQFLKNTYGSMELARYLQMRGFERVELCGLVSNICVFTNAVLAKSAVPEAEIVIVSSLTDSFDKELQQKSFDVLKGLNIEIE